MSGERGCLWYTRATATISFYFPENRVDCKHCPHMRADANGARYKCGLSGTILGRLDVIGPMCPITELDEQREEEDKKDGNGQGEDDPL